MSTPDDSRPREWSLPLNTLIINSDFNRPNGVHVIEYAAYGRVRDERDFWKNTHGETSRAANAHIAELEAERDEAHKFIEFQGEARAACQREYNALADERDELRAENERLRAVMSISSVMGMFNDEGTNK